MSRIIEQFFTVAIVGSLLAVQVGLVAQLL